MGLRHGAWGTGHEAHCRRVNERLGGDCLMFTSDERLSKCRSTQMRLSSPLRHEAGLSRKAASALPRGF